MHGSVRSQVRSAPRSRSDKQRRTLLLRLATVHSRSTSAGKFSGAMGTWKTASAVRWRSTASRKKAQVRNRATSVALSWWKALHWASCSSHG